MFPATGSISSTEVACGEVNMYCPEGSGSPITASKGHYTIGGILEVEVIPGDNSNRVRVLEDNLYKESRVAQEICPKGSYCASDGWVIFCFVLFILFSNFHRLGFFLLYFCMIIFLFSGIRRLCPAGRFGATEGLDTIGCSGPCSAGYFCPIGSVADTEVQCGAPSLFCPGGMGAPLEAANGYYTVGTGLATRYAERKCEPGSWCTLGVKRLCPFGHWGSEFGLNSSSCSGLCEPGYYCPEGSISSTSVQCGDGNKYCPGFGNIKPVLVTRGYYSIGESSF